MIQDEVLAHRIGLIPIKVDPDMLSDFVEGEDPTDQNTVVFRLDVQCLEENEPVQSILRAYTLCLYSIVL